MEDFLKVVSLEINAGEQVGFLWWSSRLGEEAGANRSALKYGLWLVEYGICWRREL